jgi:hypothetical protein
MRVQLVEMTAFYDGLRKTTGRLGLPTVDRAQLSMSILRPGRRRVRARAVSAALLLAASSLLSGCSSMFADHLPNAAGGLPEGAPARPATPVSYPAVHDMPPARPDVMLSDAEAKKLQADLIAARNKTDADTTGATAKP